jgi:carbonic anhydrase
VAIVCAIGAAGGKSPTERVKMMNSQDALDSLLAGNQRFVNGNVLHQRESAEWREKLTKEQHPFATILACSDSRVPVELLFDQGFGDLFVIRVAGNVIGEDEVGSIEYAMVHLNTPLVFVLGHESCGAVTAALLPEEKRKEEPAGIQKLLTHIDPALEGLDNSLDDTERLQRAVEANVLWSIKQLKDLPEVQSILDSGECRIVGGVYDLDTGRVSIIDDGGSNAE